MNQNKFNIISHLYRFTLATRTAKREQIREVLDVSNTRLSSIIHINADEQYDFTVTEASKLSAILECTLEELYDTKFWKSITTDYAKKLVE